MRDDGIQPDSDRTRRPDKRPRRSESQSSSARWTSVYNFRPHTFEIRVRRALCHRRRESARRHSPLDRYVRRRGLRLAWETPLAAALEVEEVAGTVQRGDGFRIDDIAPPDHRERFLKWNPADANHLVVIECAFAGRQLTCEVEVDSLVAE